MDQERRLPPQADPALPAGDSPQAAISLFPRYGLGSLCTHRPTYLSRQISMRGTALPDAQRGCR